MRVSKAHVPVDWPNIETILLDMDGTVLDLAFDNHFWLVLVPDAYGRHRGLPSEHARATIKARYDRVAGHLNWYCLDYWSAELGLDLRALKQSHRHLIGFLPGAVAFLERARAIGKRLVIVTNAHPDTLALKLRQTRLDTFVAAVVSSHGIGFAKEDPRFWPALAERLDYDVASSLLIEDSVPVAQTAAAQGVRTLLIRWPDSTQARRELDPAGAIDGLGDLIATMPS
jgi:GMP/IMP 5'-nucleotidase